MSKETMEYLEDANGKCIHSVVKATPNTGGGSEYVRLQFVNGDTYLWNDDVANYSVGVTSLDPEVETRWVQE